MDIAGTSSGIIADYNLWVDRQNKEFKAWTNKVQRKLKASASRFQHGKEGMVMRGKRVGNPHQEAKLADSLGHKFYMSYGMAEGVGFKLERHGVFVHKGVGRGYVMNDGVVIRGYKTGKEEKLYAKAKNRDIGKNIPTGGTMKRRPVEWFNPILDATLPELADKIAVINADAAINFENARIK
jgi:hypothetical protein